MMSAARGSPCKVDAASARESEASSLPENRVPGFIDEQGSYYDVSPL
ncbi:MAG: hypothetical protein IK077_05035 [Thermoguttaceae bacterium]|nr:hypothetical protein [Thermoguttaceae bacterium]